MALSYCERLSGQIRLHDCDSLYAVCSRFCEACVVAVLSSARWASGRLPRAVLVGLIVVLTALIALADISLRPLTFASLYMIPMILGAQHFRRSTSVLVLSITLILLNYVGLATVFLFDEDHLAHFRLINRGFVALALTGSALIAVFYLRIRDYWLTRQSVLAPRDEEVSLLLQAFQMFEDITSCIIAIVIAGVTFVIDLKVPEGYNLAILYLVPLAVMAITRSRLLLWSATPVLLVLAYVGLVYGPHDPLPGGDPAIILNNRCIAGAAIVLAAVLFHVTGQGQPTNPATTAEPGDATSTAPPPA